MSDEREQSKNNTSTSATVAAGVNGTTVNTTSTTENVRPPASPSHQPQQTGHPTVPGYEQDPAAFSPYYQAFPVQPYPIPPGYYSDAGISPVAYAQTPPLGPTGTVSPFPSQSPYLAPVANGTPYQSPTISPSGSATAAQFYFYSQNHASPFLHPVQMSPTLSAISSAPGSPHLSGCPSPTPSFNGSGRNYARSNVSRYAAYDSFVSSLGGSPGLTTNVYIRGLPSNTTDEGLHAMCAAYGTIVSSKAIIDQKTGECKGYGFAMYANEEQARAAIDALNAKGFQASFAKESFSTKLKNLQDPNSTNIYVSNLPPDFDEAKLDELFQPYKIMSKRILRDANGVSRGVGFARMETREAAQEIIQKFNGYMLPGASLPLQARFADSKAQKTLKDQVARSRRICKGRDSDVPEGSISPTVNFMGGQDMLMSGVALPPQAAAQFYAGGPLPPPAGAVYTGAATGYPGYTYISPPQALPYSTMQPATAAVTAYYAQQAPMFSVTTADGNTTQPMPASMIAPGTSNSGVNEITGMMEQKLQLNDNTAQNATTTASTDANATAANAE